MLGLKSIRVSERGHKGRKTFADNLNAGLQIWFHQWSDQFGPSSKKLVNGAWVEYCGSFAFVHTHTYIEIDIYLLALQVNLCPKTSTSLSIVTCGACQLESIFLHTQDCAKYLHMYVWCRHSKTVSESMLCVKGFNAAHHCAWGCPFHLFIYSFFIVQKQHKALI